MIKGVPYDAELEYLESTGTQWIDTGIAAKPSTVSDVMFRWVGNPSGDAIILGARNNNFTEARFILLMSNQTKIRQIGTGASWRSNGYYDIDKDYHAVTTLTSGNSSQQLDGTTIITSSNALVDIGKTLYLFASNDATASYKATARVYCCKIYQNGILVRDFIPVRVGTTGYLYDRVSKKLFGNLGTGDFVLGPDKSIPLIGLHFYQKPTPTAKDYIQNGLIAMWDGIENAGWGTHDPNATTWKDLTGNGHDIAISTATFSDDAINISERSASLIHGFSTGSIRAIEISVKERLSGYCILFFGTRNRITHYFENGVNGMQFNPDRANCAVIKSGASTFAATMDADGMLLSGYADGRPNPISNWTTWSGGENYYLSPRYDSWAFAGSLRFIRIYDRIPSAAEIAYNYNIDKERFKLI